MRWRVTAAVLALGFAQCTHAQDHPVIPHRADPADWEEAVADGRVSIWNSTLQQGDYLEYLDAMDYYDNSVLGDATPCDGHGNLAADNTCTCTVDTAGTPNQCASPLYHTGVRAFTGDHCMLEVQSLQGNEALNQRLKAGRTTCHTVCWGEEPWEYLTVALERVSAEGDPDLYGKAYYDGLDQHIDDDDGTMLEGFDFEETSSAEHTNVQQSLARSTLHNSTSLAYRGAMLCVTAYGPNDVVYNLRWGTAMCPVRFSPTGGELLECGGADHGVCMDDGTCQCHTPYLPPKEGHAPDTGFEQCTAEVVELSDSVGVGRNDTFELPDGLWKFYRFHVNATEDNFVVFDLLPHHLQAGDDNGHPVLYLRHGMPPGPAFGEHDLKTHEYFWQPASDSFKSQQLIISKDTDVFRPGEWYAGVYAADGHAARYTLQLNTYKCPMDCSGHGRCVDPPPAEHGERRNATTALPSCVCDADFFSPKGKDDCSGDAMDVPFDGSRSATLETADYAYFTLPFISREFTTHNVEMEVDVSIWFPDDDSHGWFFWADQPPELLLSKGSTDPAKADVWPDVAEDDHDFRAVLSSQNHTYRIVIPASELTEGHWKAALFNPLRMRAVKYTLEARLRTSCLNNCTAPSHGTCNADGSCSCTHGWSGADCGFLTSACQINTFLRHEASADGLPVVCMKPCVCEELQCQYSDQCAWCEGEYRLWAHADDMTSPAAACVRDECERGRHPVVNETAHYTCDQDCMDPADGSARRRTGVCVPGTLSCHSPWEPASGAAAATPCVPPGDGGGRSRAAGSGGGVRVGRRRGTPAWAVWLIALAMLAVGGTGGVVGLVAFQRWQETNGAFRRPVWHQIDDDFAASGF